ncbi:hypothetical protein [Streptomyces sp. NPDC020681]|uniref:hypothetical protein n=1 Tax=Streptomyces sp. NPDC020681 TaxID=3365083 RepID=UPI0037B6C8AA
MGQPQAGSGSQIVGGIIGLLPDWLEIPLLCLLFLAIVAGWIRSIRSKLAQRRAVRSVAPVAAPQSGRQEPSGADFLGAYAPQQRQDADTR